MRNTSWMVHLTIGLLLSTAGFADEKDSSKIDNEQQPSVTLSLDALFAESPYESRWQLHHPLDAISYTSDWPQPIVDIDFQHDSALARVSRLRNLSLLTLAETGRARLFLGVNDDGLVGLHFIVVPIGGDERYLSLVRRPYLKKIEPENEVE